VLDVFGFDPVLKHPFKQTYNGRVVFVPTQCSIQQWVDMKAEEEQKVPRWRGIVVILFWPEIDIIVTLVAPLLTVAKLLFQVVPDTIKVIRFNNIFDVYASPHIVSNLPALKKFVSNDK
jgi:hypothetical protein